MIKNSTIILEIKTKLDWPHYTTAEKNLPKIKVVLFALGININGNQSSAASNYVKVIDDLIRNSIN